MSEGGDRQRAAAGGAELDAARIRRLVEAEVVRLEAARVIEARRSRGGGGAWFALLRHPLLLTLIGALIGFAVTQGVNAAADRRAALRFAQEKADAALGLISNVRASAAILGYALHNRRPDQTIARLRAAHEDAFAAWSSSIDSPAATVAAYVGAPLDGEGPHRLFEALSPLVIDLDICVTTAYDRRNDGGAPSGATPSVGGPPTASATRSLAIPDAVEGDSGGPGRSEGTSPGSAACALGGTDDAEDAGKMDRYSRLLTRCLRAARTAVFDALSATHAARSAPLAFLGGANRSLPAVLPEECRSDAR